MSLFGSFMGDDDLFNIFGSPMHTMRQMNSMMSSMFSDPFEMMGQNALVPRYGRGFNDMPVSLFDPHFGRSFDFNNMAASNAANCHSFMSQSVMTMSSGPDGRPQVYQETMSTRMAPGGIKETKKTVSDSRTGTRKMAIGHHIGERAHILERERNVRGDEEERQEFINLDEEEADSFNREWESHTRRTAGAIGNTDLASNVRANPAPRQLALPSTTDVPARRAVRSLNPLKVKSTPPSSSFKSPEPATSSKAEASSTSPHTSGSRKREHKPDRQVSNKRHAAPASDN
ncbi:myeloid leukemia factor isoform X2 [Mycetomoellerius zeteki]|uniref:myeloid leukemia factor isoform X2 n=1 Tax=Mycetomoellerius zeteki TaxID=64791 RepID=UPI00084E5B0B|nr:PREDICTED: myeloid leukemia factor isoform X2 [Trachymyrmex zeteki]